VLFFQFFFVYYLSEADLLVFVASIDCRACFVSKLGACALSFLLYSLVTAVIVFDFGGFS